MTKKIRGTQDKVSLKSEKHLLYLLKSHCQNYNFQEIATPILESEELFFHSLGQETDIVSKEIFRVQKQGSENICLRPEGTAGTVRAFLEQLSHETLLPWKVFSYGSMFRYERPQKGRWRQFEQFNIESIGAESLMSDVELILMLDRFFTHELYISDYVLKLNYLGSFEERKKYSLILKSFVDENNQKICQQCIERKEKNILRCLDCKNKECQSVYEGAPSVLDSLEQASKNRYLKTKELLEESSVNFIEDARLVRGLDYYSGIVFEFTSNHLGAQDAFCGGGRYELAKRLGHKEEIPSLGAAIGIGRLLMLLDAAENKFAVPDDKPLFAVLPLEAEQGALSMHIVTFLREHNKRSEALWGYGSVKSMMKQANRMNARYALLLGPDEMAENFVTVKDMVSGEQKKVPQREIIQLD